MTHFRSNSPDFKSGFSINGKPVELESKNGIISVSDPVLVQHCINALKLQETTAPEGYKAPAKVEAPASTKAPKEEKASKEKSSKPVDAEAPATENTDGE
jgi:hypothetical protein